MKRPSPKRLALVAVAALIVGAGGAITARAKLDSSELDSSFDLVVMASPQQDGGASANQSLVAPRT